jgi:hypothetical protein
VIRARHQRAGQDRPRERRRVHHGSGRPAGRSARGKAMVNIYWAEAGHAVMHGGRIPGL